MFERIIRLRMKLRLGPERALFAAFDLLGVLYGHRWMALLADRLGMSSRSAIVIRVADWWMLERTDYQMCLECGGYKIDLFRHTECVLVDVGWDEFDDILRNSLNELATAAIPSTWPDWCTNCGLSDCDGRCGLID